MPSTEGHCSCGEVHFQINGAPLFRANCHCTICQKFNDAPFGDVAIYKAEDIDLPPDSPVAYDVLKQPPLVQRGRCTSCGKPAIEKLNLPLFPKMMIVPVGNIEANDHMRDADFHIFYDYRVADIDDFAPKHGGFLSSQTAFARATIKGLLARRRSV